MEWGRTSSNLSIRSVSDEWTDSKRNWHLTQSGSECYSRYVPAEEIWSGRTVSVWKICALHSDGGPSQCSHFWWSIKFQPSHCHCNLQISLMHLLAIFHGFKIGFKGHSFVFVEEIQQNASLMTILNENFKSFFKQWHNSWNTCIYAVGQ